MKLRLDKMASTPKGLVVGVQIHGPKDSWLRFGLLEIPWDSVEDSIVEQYLAWKDKDERLDQLDTPMLFEDWA